MVDAIFYVLRTAIAWRDMPACYGPWNSVYTCWRRWCALGLWQEILRLLSQHAVGHVRFVDGSHIKLHQSVPTLPEVKVLRPLGAPKVD